MLSLCASFEKVHFKGSVIELIAKNEYSILVIIETKMVSNGKFLKVITS